MMLSRRTTESRIPACSDLIWTARCASIEKNYSEDVNCIYDYEFTGLKNTLMFRQGWFVLFDIGVLFTQLNPLNLPMVADFEGQSIQLIAAWIRLTNNITAKTLTFFATTTLLPFH